MSSSPWRIGALENLWDMLDFAAKRFSGMMDLVCVWGMALANERITVDEEVVWENVRIQIRHCAKFCDELTLPVSADAFRQLEGNFHKDAIGWPRDQQVLFRFARDSLFSELKNRWMVCLTSEDAQLFQASKPFGDKVAETFGRASEDVVEASKSLSLGRFTACVFHLMRVMEVAVIAIGSRLDVNTIDRHDRELEWGKILANCKTPVEAMPKGISRQRWLEVLAFLYHVKDAWRNDTMHPKQTYTREEAKAIFEAVRSFMMSLAELI